MYVPALYEVSYKEDGTIEAITAGAPITEAQYVHNINIMYYPDYFVVPSTDT